LRLPNACRDLFDRLQYTGGCSSWTNRQKLLGEKVNKLPCSHVILQDRVSVVAERREESGRSRRVTETWHGQAADAECCSPSYGGMAIQGNAEEDFHSVPSLAAA
jgi:hypothetical protein